MLITTSVRMLIIQLLTIMNINSASGINELSLEFKQVIIVNKIVYRVAAEIVIIGNETRVNNTMNM